MEPIEEGTLELRNDDSFAFWGTSSLNLQSQKIENCVWAFQFDDDEPVVFATSNDLDKNELTFTIDNSSNGSIEFCGLDGKKLKIFAKENK